MVSLLFCLRIPSCAIRFGSAAEETPAPFFTVRLKRGMVVTLWDFLGFVVPFSL
jgi:hypothetical protein